MSDYTNYDYLTSQSRNDELREEKRPRNLFLFYILPFVLINLVIFYLATARPDFKLTISDTTDFKTVNFSVSIEGFLPVSEFYCKMEDAPLEMKDVGAKTYTGVATGNGTLEVTARYFNGMVKTQYEHIGSIDDIPPTIQQQDITNGVVTVALEDTQSGINYDTIYAIDANGAHVAPMEYDEQQGTVVFQTDTDSLEVHVTDKVGNEAVANFDSLSLTMSHDDSSRPQGSTAGGGSSSGSSSSGSSSGSSSSGSGKASSSSKATTETTKASAAKATTAAKNTGSRKTTSAAKATTESSTKASSTKASTEKTSSSAKATSAAKTSSAAETAAAATKAGTAKSSTKASTEGTSKTTSAKKSIGSTKTAAE